MPLSSEARRVATSVLKYQPARRAAFKLASSRDRALVFVYHRVAPEGPAHHEIVSSLPLDLFRRQIEALAIVGDIVPLRQLLDAPGRADRPRFAITFDDDDVGHVKHALPVLQAVGAPATFFLSGRVLHGLPPYWWTVLELSIRSRGLESTGRALGLHGVTLNTPADLAGALEGAPLCDQVTALLPAPPDTAMSRRDIRALADAGMTIGFHTLHHPVVSLLEGVDLEAALTTGRRELAAAAGRPVDLLAYPYGRVSFRAALAAERAGFAAAWATGGRPITHQSDPFRLGRWEPGSLEHDHFLAAVAVRLLRSPTPSRDSREASLN